MPETTNGGTIRPFRQVDVFGTTPYLGNAVAVVHDADRVTSDEMQQIALWTNLSETTFLAAPSNPGADYGVRIFTPTRELPFAGHPTLGSAHAWLEAGGVSQHPDRVIQECGIGLVPLQRTPSGLAFAAPPLRRAGPASEELRGRVIEMLGVDPSRAEAVEWVDNGPGWIGVLVDSAETVLALRPGAVDRPIGVVGPHPAGAAAQFEVRAFVPSSGSTAEDPVTGSLNASLALWLLGSGRAHAPYVASQGAAIGHSGHVHVTRDAAGEVWIAGSTRTLVEGAIDVSTMPSR
ncbi:MAG TPA: PhzF family phenazine biosynthesis protein [Acidimicrobiales bacterium]|nr:PhzF family phenazine biosynthesis protein [Acidimicrobiales bacterium]